MKATSNPTHGEPVSVDGTVLIEWAGMMTGLLGSVLLALNGSIAGWGFALYLGSNVLWILSGMRRKVWALVGMMSCYSIVSAYGIYNWLIATH